MGGVVSWAALPGELVQSRQLPDGLVEVRVAGRADPVLFLIEISTYPDNRVPGQMVDDLRLAYLDRGEVPEAVTLVLHPKGNLRVEPGFRAASPLGGAELAARWRVIELWTIPVTDFLPVTDAGLAPWLTLTHIEGPPEPVLQQLRDAIDRGSAGTERENLLVAARVLGGLVYNDALMEALFRGGNPMLEFPLLTKWFREREVLTRQQVVLEELAARFGPVPDDVSAAVRVIADEQTLRGLNRLACKCESLTAFRPAVGL